MRAQLLPALPAGGAPGRGRRHLDGPHRLPLHRQGVARPRPTKVPHGLATAVKGARRKGMVWIPGGTFAMGSDRHYPEEAPVREVTVDGFWMDEHPVTNLEFLRFVKETGHVTWAEREPGPGRLPGREAGHALRRVGRLPEVGGAGRPEQPLTTGGPGRAGADWRHPRRPGELARTGASGIRSCTSRSTTRRRTPPGRARSCRPRRSGSSPRAAASTARSTPGATSSRPKGKPMANTWQGEFPYENTAARRLRGHVAGRLVPAERLRPLRHDRQRLGVDDRLVLHAGHDAAVALLRRRPAGGERRPERPVARSRAR